MNSDDAVAYAAFGKWIQSCYGKPVASTAGPAGGANVTLSIPAGATIDRVSAMEDQTQGEGITGWQIRAKQWGGCPLGVLRGAQDYPAAAQRDDADGPRDARVRGHCLISAPARPGLRRL
jgi:hypothetical protein